MKNFLKITSLFFLLVGVLAVNTADAADRTYSQEDLERARLSLEALMAKNEWNNARGKSEENFYIFSTTFADDACELEKIIRHGHNISGVDCQYLQDLNKKLKEINRHANFYVFLDGIRVSEPFVVNEEEAGKIRSKNPEKLDIPVLQNYYSNIYEDVEQFSETLFRQSKLGSIGDDNGALLTVTEMLNYLPAYENDPEQAFITYAKSIVLGEKYRHCFNPIWLKLREKSVGERSFSIDFKKALDTYVSVCSEEFRNPSEALPCVELLDKYQDHDYLDPDNFFYRIVIANPCVLANMQKLGNPPPESQWMKDFNRVVSAALWVAFAPVAIEVLAPIIIEAAVALGTEKVLTDAALGAVIDAALQATIIYYFDLEEDNRNWEEIEKRIDYYQITASSIESIFTSKLLEAMISTASSCVVDGYTEQGKLRESFDGVACLQGALSNLIVTGVLNGGKAFKKLKRYATNKPEKFVGKTINLIQENIPSFELSEASLLKVFEQFGIDPEVVKRVWKSIVARTGNLAIRLKDFPNLAAKLKELQDKGKKFLDDFADASRETVETIGKNPNWVYGWQAVKDLPESVRRNTTNLESLSKAMKQDGYGADYFETLLKSKDNPQKFLDDYVSKIGDNGKFADDALESDYASYLTRKAREGKPPRDRTDWNQARDYWLNDSPMARGNAFNETARIEGWYPFDEVTLANGKRVDSYRLPEGGNPGEIVSRKATDLGDIQLSTFESYLSEMKVKYAPGTLINAPKYGNELKGKVLEGDLILELPDGNLNLSNIQDYIDLAKNKGITLRFKPE